jgi:hypothetical protein
MNRLNETNKSMNEFFFIIYNFLHHHLHQDRLLVNTLEIVRKLSKTVGRFCVCETAINA